MVPKATDLCTMEDNCIVFLGAEVFLDIQAREQVMLVQRTVTKPRESSANYSLKVFGPRDPHEPNLFVVFMSLMCFEKLHDSCQVFLPFHWQRNPDRNYGRFGL